MVTTDESVAIRAKVTAELLDDPYQSNAQIALRTNVAGSTVGARRRELEKQGRIPPRFEAGTNLVKPHFDRIAEAIKEDLEKPTEYLAQELDVNRGTVAQVRQILVARGVIPDVPLSVRLKRAKNMQRSKLSDGLTPKQRSRAAARFIDSSVITLDSIVFAMESIEPEDVDLDGKREDIDKMVADAGKIRQFFSRVINERNGSHAITQ